MQKKLGRNTVVLLGVGHTNAHVLRMWKMKPLSNAQLVCVSNFPNVTYSGMMPGVLAGQYDLDAMEIDLVRLTQSAGARLIVDHVVGVDREKKRLLFRDRPALAYDALSIGIGSRPSIENVVVHSTAPLVPVKPMQTFMDRLDSRIDLVASVSPNPTKIVIVGGGVGSIEIAFCLDQRFKSRSKEPANGCPEICLLTSGETVGAGLLPSTSKRITARLASRNIQLRCGARVQSIGDSGLALTNGDQVSADIVIWATGAVAPELLDEFDFEKDSKGFLLTRNTLQTKSDDHVFAVGDSGTIVNEELDKAGVYAVRQGPVLWNNIRRLLEKRKLQQYRPQRDFLKLVNVGDGTAVSEYRGRSFEGGFWWRAKDYIDRKFMRMYQSYEPMKMVAEEPEDPADMKCLGCGGKVGSEILSAVLDELEVPSHPDVIVGLENPDDAAIIKTHGGQVTVTTDFFAAPFDDPYLIGRIALLNSASDCFVMGARPSSALAIVQVPLGHPRAQLQVMRELMAGSIDELRRFGATIIGGHTIEGPRLMIGFTILGSQISEARTKGLLQVGDQLVTSKPIGTGALLAAMMQCEMPSESYTPLMNSMVGSNAIALDLIERFPVSAVTDVTGFGLAGHLGEMLLASQMSAELAVDSIPLLPGFSRVVQAGIESTLAPDNRAVASKIELPGIDIQSPKYAGLFDPQTSGGLLLGVQPQHTAEVTAFLNDAGFGDTAVIGTVTEAAQTRPELKVI